MYVCMPVFIYTCMYVCIQYVYIFVFICICMYVCKKICITLSCKYTGKFTTYAKHLCFYVYTSM